MEKSTTSVIVKVISIIFLVSAVPSIIASVILLSGGSIMIGGIGGGTAYIPISIMLLSTSILGILSGVWLWKLKNWARVVSLIIAIFWVVQDILTLIFSRMVFTEKVPLWIIQMSNIFRITAHPVIMLFVLAVELGIFYFLTLNKDIVALFK